MRKKRSTFARKGRHDGPTMERREPWAVYRRLRLAEAREQWRADPRRRLPPGEERAYEAAHQKRQRKLYRPGYLGSC